MNIEAVRIVDGKLLLQAKDAELHLTDGVYRRDDGESITVRGHQIVNVLTMPNLDKASKMQLESFITDLNQELTTVLTDSETSQLDLQQSVQQLAAALQLISNLMKAYHDTAKAIIQNMR